MELWKKMVMVHGFVFIKKNHMVNIYYGFFVLCTNGYCKPEIPNITSRIGVNGEIRYIYRFRTFTYSSFNWIYDSFYIQKGSQRTKIVPSFITEYLSPLALAVWIMDDGSKYKNKGLKFCTNSFGLWPGKVFSKSFRRQI